MEQNSSMKTIAVVTMAFLPGTFFATLFAVPSLQWDQSPVIQSSFWIYWVFTLPFTAIVMGMWYFSTRDWRQQIRDAKRNLVSAWPNKQHKQGQV
jgi:Mg2+ and Co2+ transporter CorA